MALDLLNHCSPAVLDGGLALYRAGGITCPDCTEDADGSLQYRGKATDSFNFVSHPRLTLDRQGQTLLDFGCDCENGRRHSLCVHCVGLYHALTGLCPTPMEAAPLPEPAVAPVPDPEPVELRSMEILLGDSEGSPVFWCPNDTDRVFHTNVGIIGTMGTGKTQLAKSLLTQLYRQQRNNYDGSPLGILIFDYKGDYNETKQDFVRATNARILKPYRLPFNPLAITPGRTFKPLLPLHTASEFKDTVTQIYELGPKQQQMLLDCILDAYRQYGITPQDPLTWERQAPTVETVYQVYREQTGGKTHDKLSAAMDMLHQFCLFEADPRRAMSLDALLQGVVVIDLSGYDSNIQNTVVAITLNQFYARMQAQGSSATDGRLRQLRRFIMVDEADSFMDREFPSLRRIMTEGREFGVGVILSTQSLKHYAASDEDYSRYVLTWLVHNVADLKQRDVEYIFKLRSKSEDIPRHYAAIKGLQKHESLVKLGNGEPLILRNKAFYQLYQEITARGEEA